MSFGFSFTVQGDTALVISDLGWVDTDLGWWATSVAAYCPSRRMEHPESKSTQPRSETTSVTLYKDLTCVSTRKALINAVQVFVQFLKPLVAYVSAEYKLETLTNFVSPF